MRNRNFLLAFVLLLAVPFVALAASAYIKVEERLTTEQMHETGLDTLTPEQLARLNEVLEADEAARPVATATAPATGAPPDGEHSFLGLSDEPIRSRVKGNVSGWEPGTVFELENGQQWKVLKGSMKLHKPLASPEIVVAPGLVGRWFLQVDEDLPKARVYRVD
jgi:hypothetical protein